MAHAPEPSPERRRPLAARSRQTPLLQRRCACGGVAGPDGECESCKKKRRDGLLQRKTADPKATASRVPDVPSSVHQTLQAPGQSLDNPVRAQLEPRFNRDFSKVKIHTDPAAARSAEDVNAAAYTVGSNVVFGAGKYSPNTDSGRALLAHELAHVVQQDGAAYDPNRPLSVGAADTSLEHEAEAAASPAASSSINGRTEGEVQRTVDKPDAAPAAPESDCSGWFADHESLSKRAAEKYVQTELGGSHGAVKKIECDMVADNGAFACTVTFSDGTPIRVIARPDSIVVGKFPLQTMTPPADQPLCWYSFKCIGPNRDLVLTRIKCQSATKPSADKPVDDHHGKGPNP